MAEKKLGFLEHLGELRKRIVRAAIAIVIAASVSYIFAYRIIDIVVKPAGDIKLHYLGPLEPLMVQIKIAIFAGLILSSPIWIYQLLAFLAPALKKKEKKVFYIVVIAIVILFFSGVLFGYFFIMPTGIEWLLKQGKGHLEQTITIDRYISFAGWFILGFGLAFETPVAILLLIKLGIIDRKTLRKNWRYAYVIILLVAAVITPDWNPVTMLLLALPMIVLFEITLIIGKFIS